MTACTVHFCDDGQDFLEWDLDATGLVVDCRPFQASVWVGVRVLNQPRAGNLLRIRTKASAAPITLNHRVERTVRRKGKAA